MERQEKSPARKGKGVVTHRLDVDHLKHGLGAREFRYGGFGHLDAAPAVVRGLLDAEVGFHPFQEFSLQRSALRERMGGREFVIRVVSQRVKPEQASEEVAHLGLEPAFEFLQADDGPDAVHRDSEFGTDGADDLRVCGVLLENVVQVGVVDAGLCDIGQGRQRVEGRVQREGLRMGVRLVSARTAT